MKHRSLPVVFLFKQMEKKNEKRPTLFLPLEPDTRITRETSQEGCQPGSLLLTRSLDYFHQVILVAKYVSSILLQSFVS